MFKTVAYTVKWYTSAQYSATKSLNLIFPISPVTQGGLSNTLISTRGQLYLQSLGHRIWTMQYQVVLSFSIFIAETMKKNTNI